MWGRKEAGISAKRFLDAMTSTRMGSLRHDGWFWGKLMSAVADMSLSRACGKLPCSSGARVGEEVGNISLEAARVYMIICNLGKSVIILGRHVHTEKKDSLFAKCIEKWVRTWIIMSIMTTDNAFLHMPGLLWAKHFKWVILILRITPQVDFISPIYWWENQGLEGRAGIRTHIWSTSKSLFLTISP